MPLFTIKYLVRLQNIFTYYIVSLNVEPPHGLRWRDQSNRTLFTNNRHWNFEIWSVCKKTNTDRTSNAASRTTLWRLNHYKVRGIPDVQLRWQGRARCCGASDITTVHYMSASHTYTQAKLRILRCNIYLIQLILITFLHEKQLNITMLLIVTSS